MQSNAFADRGHVHRLDARNEHLGAETKVHEAFAADRFEQLHGAFDGDVVWRRALAIEVFGPNARDDFTIAMRGQHTCGALRQWQCGAIALDDERIARSQSSAE